MLILRFYKTARPEKIFVFEFSGFSFRDIKNTWNKGLMRNNTIYEYEKYVTANIGVSQIVVVVVF